jgi:hypothetical protein
MREKIGEDLNPFYTPYDSLYKQILTFRFIGKIIYLVNNIYITFSMFLKS